MIMVFELVTIWFVQPGTIVDQQKGIAVAKQLL
jgi:hypothetical protein